MSNSLLQDSLIRSQGASRRYPEFTEAIQELSYASTHAQKLLSAGKMTKADHTEFERHLISKYIDALPVEVFSDRMKDGSLADLQAMAGYDDDRDASDVNDTRAEIYRMVQRDAVDDAWLSQKIDSKQYAEMNRDIEGNAKFGEEMHDRLSRGDNDGAASELFASRHDVSKHDADLDGYLSKTYGKDYRGHEDAPKAAASEKPSGRVVREEAAWNDKKSNDDNIKSLFKPGATEPAEPRSATDSQGILDLDVLAELERADG